jgi:membrane protease YdiL (CAAX protease family)
MLLGAFFGYVYYWSRSLWVPIICHAFNNSMVVVLTWLGMNSDEIGVHSPLLICGSVLLTAAGIYLLRRR